MAWIKVFQTLPRHKKTQDLSVAMKWQRRYTVGFLIEMWLWAIDHAEDGDFSKISKDEFAAYFDFSQEDAEKCILALKAVGFFTADMRINNWNDYVARFLEGRRKSVASKLQPTCNQNASNLQPKCDSSDDQSKSKSQSKNKSKSKEEELDKEDINGIVPAIAETLPPKKDIDKVFSAEAISLTDRLIALMRVNNPNCRIPTSLYTWHTEADRILRLDKKPYDEAVSVLEWSQQDNFWKTNILSMPTFREKYDKLFMQMKYPKKQGGVYAVEPREKNKYKHIV